MKICQICLLIIEPDILEKHFYISDAQKKRDEIHRAKYVIGWIQFLYSKTFAAATSTGGIWIHKLKAFAIQSVRKF